jgi:hypothetical protein
MREIEKTMMTFAQFAEDQNQLAEVLEPTSQTRSTVLTLLRRVQQIHQSVIANPASTHDEKETSAEIMCVAALMGLLIGSVLNDATIVQRSRAIWA